MAGKASGLTSARIAAYGLAFIRNIMLARLLPKADFGLVAIFAVTVSLLELTGKLAFGQQIIQSKNGEDHEFQATAHLFQFVCGIVSCILLCVLSFPLAEMTQAPHAVLAFAMLGVVPLSRGLEHLDTSRLQRTFQFGPTIASDLVPQVIVTLLTLPLAYYLGDYRAIIWIILLKATLSMAITHLTAERKYRWTWNPTHVKRLAEFGWPLLVNSFLLFLSQQADQVVISSMFSLGDLANYALALSLVTVPLFIFAQVSSSLMLPILSSVQDKPAQFEKRYQECLGYAAIASIATMLPLIVMGENLVVLFYGSKYSGTGGIVAALASASALRFLRVVPTIAAMARADTLNQLYGNLLRTLNVPLAIGCAFLGGDVVLLATCGCAAEILSGAYVLNRLKSKTRIAVGKSGRAVAYTLAFLAAGVGWCILAQGRSLPLDLLATIIGLIVAAAVALAVFPGCGELFRVVGGAKLQRWLPVAKDSSTGVQ